MADIPRIPTYVPVEGFGPIVIKDRGPEMQYKAALKREADKNKLAGKGDEAAFKRFYDAKDAKALEGGRPAVTRALAEAQQNALQEMDAVAQAAPNAVRLAFGPSDQVFGATERDRAGAALLSQRQADLKRIQAYNAAAKRESDFLAALRQTSEGAILAEQYEGFASARDSKILDMWNRTRDKNGRISELFDFPSVETSIDAAKSITSYYPEIAKQIEEIATQRTGMGSFIDPQGEQLYKLTDTVNISRPRVKDFLKTWLQTAGTRARRSAAVFAPKISDDGRPVYGRDGFVEVDEEKAAELMADQFLINREKVRISGPGSGPQGGSSAPEQAVTRAGTGQRFTNIGWQAGRQTDGVEIPFSAANVAQAIGVSDLGPLMKPKVTANLTTGFFDSNRVPMQWDQVESKVAAGEEPFVAIGAAFNVAQNIATNPNATEEEQLAFFARVLNTNRLRGDVEAQETQRQIQKELAASASGLRDIARMKALLNQANQVIQAKVNEQGVFTVADLGLYQRMGFPAGKDRVPAADLARDPALGRRLLGDNYELFMEKYRSGLSRRASTGRSAMDQYDAGVRAGLITPSPVAPSPVRASPTPVAPATGVGDAETAAQRFRRKREADAAAAGQQAR